MASNVQSMQQHLRTPITTNLYRNETSLSPGVFTSISLPFKKRRSRSDVSDLSSTSLPFKKRKFLIIPIGMPSDDEHEADGSSSGSTSSRVALSPIAVPSSNRNQEHPKVMKGDASSAIACVTPVPKQGRSLTAAETHKSSTNLPSLGELDTVGSFARLLQNQPRQTRSSSVGVSRSSSDASSAPSPVTTKSSENRINDAMSTISETKQSKSTKQEKRPRDTLYRGERAEEIRCLAISTRGKRCCYAAVACNGNEYCHRHTSIYANGATHKSETSNTATKPTKESNRSIPVRSSPRGRSMAPSQPKATPPVAAAAPRSPRALSDISSDLWKNQTVRICNGVYESETATVLRWGNGWVTVELALKQKRAKNPSKILHNRRSYDLFLV